MTSALPTNGLASCSAAPRRALVSWVLFDWAAQPFYTLVLTFLFAPYFASVVVGDVARGQTMWGYAAAAAGILIAVGSPLLGALADGRGRRKPWIAAFAVILILSLTALWFATPQSSTATLALILVAFVLATAAAEFMSVFVNAMMPGLVPPSQLGRLSGIGWGTGYAGGLVSLAIMAGLIVVNAATGKTFLGYEPLFKLDAASHEADRLVGPFAAAWFALFVIPYFLFVPDVRRPGAVTQEATHLVRGSAWSELWDTIRSLPSHPSMLFFLIARMIYSDGLSAIFAFGGIYGTAVFQWGTQELALFGIALTLAGVFGAIIGGFIDDRVGSKTVILVSLAILIAGALGILSVDQTRVLYSLDVTPKAPGSGAFSSAGEQVFLAFAILVGLVAAPVQSASRALLARLAPPDKMTQYFGLFAFSGKVTAFMAPLMVAAVTQATGNQRMGMASIVLFLIVGMALMLPVKERSSA